MRTKNAIKSSVLEIIPIIIISIIGFVKTRVFISYLGSDMNGYFQFINQFISYLFLAEAGFATALTYKFYKPVAEKNIKKVSEIFYGGLKIFRKIATIISIGILILTIFFVFYIKENAIIKGIIILSFILISFSNVIAYFFYSKAYQSLFASNQQNYKASLITNITRIISEIIIIAVTIIYPSLLVIAFIMFFFKIIEEIIFKIICNKTFKLESVPKEKYDTTAYKMTKDLIASQIGYLAFNNIDIIIIMFTKSLGAAAVSIYSTYNYIQKFVFSLVAKVSVVVMNLLGNIFAKDSKEKSKQIFNEYLIFDFLIATICGICFFIGARGFVNIWVNEKEYIVSIVTVTAFAYNLFASICMEPLTSVIAANGLFKDSKYYTLISSFTNLVLSILLSIYIGIAGILIATAISYTLDIYFRSRLIQKRVFNEYKMKIYTKFILASVLFISILLINIKLEKLFFMNCSSFLIFGLYICLAFILSSIITLIIYRIFFKQTKDLIIRFERLVKRK